LTWNDGGGSGSVTVPASYQSPLPITVTQGVEIGFYSGSIIAGDAFTVGVQLPRDTFTYTVQSEPFTKPGVVVSYNDPQGNHRFISPVELGDLGSDLAPYAGQMLAPLSLEIATTAAFTPTGSNTTNYVFNLPDSRPVEEGHLFVEYVKDDGTVVAEQVFTQTLQPGPNIIPVAWNSSIFTETYQADHDYNVLALVTDWQGNIIQSIARPLSSFQTDPTPAFAMSDADAAWDFGTATQGEILEHTFIFANTGFLDLYTYLAAPSDMNVTGGWSRRLSPSDTTTYTITADTRTLPVGAYDKTITIRTSDPANTARTVHLSGDVQALAGAALSRPIIYRPWDRSVWIPGSHNPNDDVDFSHGITTDPAEVEPLYVYDEGRGTLLGTGETLPAELAGGALPASVFGSGSDGELVVATGQVAYADDVRRSISGTISPGATALIVDDTSGFASGDVVLIHQTRGSEAGKWELARLSSVGAQLVLTRPTEHNYVDGGGSADNQAQVVRVPQYSTCTIDQNGVVTVHPWDGQTGGILAFLCSRTLQMSGTISANGSNGIFAPAGTDYAPGAVGGGFRGGYARRGALHSQAGQGEGYPGMASGTRNANGNGGGGAGGGNGVEGGGGGGGGHGTPGAAGYCPNCGNSIGQGSGGGTFGTEDLSTMVFGGGGGGGANDDYNGSDEGAGSGGSGGGAVIIHAREIQLSGLVTASGGDGADVGKDGGGGGGGAGGAILIKGQSMTLGAARIKAIGGAGGVPVPDDGRSRGGDGGVGRIRVEYQNITPGWSTEPQATTQTVRFFLMEKLGDVMVRYTLPESFTGGRTYWMQFGQRYVYPASGDHIFHVRLPKGRYADARLDLILAKANSSPVSLCLDMGNDGACDWTYSGSPTIPFTTTTTSLVTPLNAFLASAAPDPDGVVVVPIRVNLNTGGELFLTNLVATPTAGVDVSVSPSDLAFGATTPTEGESVSVSATLHNPSDRNTGPLTASFQATPSGGAPWHIGSTFVSNVPAGGTAQAQIVWNTLGFTGTVPVKVTVDPFNRLPETNESNNQATANLTIKTRPDLQFTNFQLSDPEPVAGETVTATLPVHNNGQATAGNEMVALYNGNPDAGGTVVGAGLAPALAGGATANVTFAWTPATPGLHRLFARADRDRQVNESDEGNNDRWQDVYVGFRSPIALDAGITAADPPYTPTLGYGVVDTGQADILANCGAEPHETYRLDPSGAVAYRFDHLLPGHFYHLDLVLYECGQGAGRQEYVKADGNALAGPEDLGDSQVHRLSLLLDPALYADRTISVTVEAREGLGALVNQIALHDVDYRYADSGSATEPAYPAAQAQAAAAAAGLSYGYLDGSRTSDWGTLPYQTARVDLLNSDVRYRFDGLDPLRRYKLRLSFYQGSGSNRVQQIYVDDQPVGAEITIVSGGRYSSTVTVPLTAYTGDGSIVASVVRTNATVGAMVNEIALEEETLSAAAVCSVTETPFWTQAYGNVIIAGQPALPGTLVTAETPRGEVVGCFVVKSTGLYGFLPIYGEDLTASPAIPGMRDGETVIFRVNGALAVATPALAWYDDKTPHQVHLAAGVTRSQAILVKPGWNLASFRVDPPAPLVDTVLHSIAGKYCRLLAESAIYDCNVPERFRTLRELHAAVGYYLRLEGSASATLLVEGVTVPVTTPLALHRGWNWTGYLPEISLPVTVALQSIAGQYLQVTDGSKTYDPALPDFSTLTQLDPGKGYLIYASAAVSLTYPAGGGTAAAAAPEGRSGVCPEAAETPFFTFLYGDIRINGQPAAAGARIEAITPRGQVAGCFTVDRAGQYGFLPVYGDDGGNPPIPGFREGEPIALRVNGAAITLPSPLAWTDDKSSHRLDLAVGDDDEKRIYLPVITR